VTARALVGARSDAGTALQMFQNSMGRYKVLTYDQETELFKRIEEGDQKARDAMVAANLRLVYSIALKFLWAPTHYTSLDLIDLVQEGCIGLLTAIGKFDWREGYKFSTYATWWIRQAIARAIHDKADVIRLPVYLAERRGKVHATLNRLLAEGLIKPTIKQIAKASKVDVAIVEKILKYDLIVPVSLDEPVRDEDSSSLGDLIEDKGAKEPLQELLQEMVKARFMEMVQSIKAAPRDKMILSLRLGFEDGHSWTLEEIAGVFEVTKERVRQVTEKCLEEIRAEYATEIAEFASFDFGPDDDTTYITEGIRR
jgi:RNA polymerase primary sigma factor